MKHPDQKSESVLITHIVNPHQFYYKYTNRIGNSEFSKFDFEIQLYGNDLYAQKTHDGYVPVEKELVIFFNVIFNKWIRARVISIGQEITFWCIDNGIWEKFAAPHILPLTERFHEDMNLVHLGGLSLLPTEKTLNVETVEVETQLSREWDKKSINLFKTIVSTSKTIVFTGEFVLENHKFGSLAVESKTASKKEINRILLEMNNAAHSHQYSDDDLWVYVHEARLQGQLYKSILDGSSIPTVNVNPTTVHQSFLKYGSEMSSIENLAPNDSFDDSVSRQSSSDVSTVLEPDVKSTICHRQTEEARGEYLKSTISHTRPEMSNGKGLYDLACGNTSYPSQISRSQNGSKSLTEECHLRVCKSYYTESVRQQPLRSTMNWISSMNKSNTSVTASRNDKSCATSIINFKDDRQSNQTSSTSPTENVPATSNSSRIKKFADKVQKISASDSTVKKSANEPNPRFGIPAGYAKNCLDTFGGLNIS